MTDEKEFDSGPDDVKKFEPGDRVFDFGPLRCPPGAVLGTVISDEDDATVLVKMDDSAMGEPVLYPRDVLYPLGMTDKDWIRVIEAIGELSWGIGPPNMFAVMPPLPPGMSQGGALPEIKPMMIPPANGASM